MPIVQSDSTVDNRTDRPGSYSIPRLGVDADGRTHYYADETHRILVYNVEGEVVHREDLHGRDLSDWVAYVTATLGWEQPPGDWVHMLSEALERAMEDGA